MVEAQVWHYFLTGSSALSRRPVIEALRKAGLKTYAWESNQPNDCGILFFDEISSGLCELLRELSGNGRERVLAVASRQSNLSNGGAWQLLQAGASDVFAWDHSREPAGEVAARFDRWKRVDEIVNSPLVQNNLVGESSSWRAVLRQIVEVARFTNASILITGESGTGKELVARLIHTLDPRPQKHELVTLDCTTIVPELSGSEFFGHDRGSYTGAVAAREGAFALADGGTLFLDEVGELSLRLQAELLRVVQERMYKRVGSNTWQQTNFRLVCATNRDLSEEEAQGRFRRDFYFRIASLTCKLPSLDERANDILPLARYFLRQLQSDKDTPDFDQPVREYLLRRKYPGNVRDLKQLVLRMAHRHVGDGPITVGDIMEDERPTSALTPADWRDVSFEQAIGRALSLGVKLKEISSAAADTAIHIAIRDEAGNLQRAARKLGVTDRALQLRRAVQREEVKQLTAENTRGNGSSPS